jgi:hypothetical protein
MKGIVKCLEPNSGGGSARRIRQMIEDELEKLVLNGLLLPDFHEIISNLDTYKEITHTFESMVDSDASSSTSTTLDRTLPINEPQKYSILATKVNRMKTEFDRNPTIETINKFFPIDIDETSPGLSRMVDQLVLRFGTEETIKETYESIIQNSHNQVRINIWNTLFNSLA